MCILKDVALIPTKKTPMRRLELSMAAQASTDLYTHFYNFWGKSKAASAKNYGRLTKNDAKIYCEIVFPNSPAIAL